MDMSSQILCGRSQFVAFRAGVARPIRLIRHSGKDKKNSGERNGGAEQGREGRRARRGAVRQMTPIQNRERKKERRRSVKSDAKLITVKASSASGPEEACEVNFACLLFSMARSRSTPASNHFETGILCHTFISISFREEEGPSTHAA